MITFIGTHPDIMGHDMVTNEQIMSWFMDTYSAHQGYAVPGIVTGKPVSVGGTYGRRESTGRGTVYLIERAAHQLKLKLSGGTAVIQGYGNVGAVAARGLAFKNGMHVIAISDISGAYRNDDGIDIKAVDKHVEKYGALAGFSGADSIPVNELLTTPCDVLIPAAVSVVINPNNAPKLPSRILTRPPHAPPPLPPPTCRF